MSNLLCRVHKAQQGRVDSLAEAKARIEQQDREVLQVVQGIMAKYRRGDYVPEVRNVMHDAHLGKGCRG